jgi:hypothetical protein
LTLQRGQRVSNMLRSLCLALFFLSLAPALWAEEKTYPVQVIDTGNTAESVSLGNDEKTAEKYTWFASDKPLDPQKFSVKMLKGDKRKDIAPEDFKAVFAPDNLLKYFGLQPKPVALWYYKSFIAPSNPRSTLALRLGKISDTDEVYLNGVLIGKSGDAAAKHRHAWDKVRIYDVPAVLLKPLEKNILLVKVDTYFDNEYGITRDRVEIGDSAKMNRELIVADITVLVFLACYLTFGGYFLFLFIRRPEEKPYLLFFVFIVSLVIYQLLQTQVKYFLSSDFLFLKRIEYVALLTIAPAFYFYLREFFKLRENKFFRYVHWGLLLMIALNAVVLAIVMFSSEVTVWANYNEILNVNISMRVFLVASAVIVGYKIFKKDKDARIIMVGLLFLIATFVIDNLIYRGILNMPRISSYVIFMFLMSLAFILANQFVRVHHQVEDLNRNLELKVQERTHELQQTLQRVQELKSQQDGDYFLTSLLIEPLSANRVASERTEVEFFLKEKKEFSFRRWSRDIGGDMCVAHTVELRGRKFTVALNADAMGKSMQGAGGALVLGSVFASIIERTQNAANGRDAAPETWLKSAFFELNRVFESFDGSMLVSIVLTAIDDEAGVMYYINAEHPWTILFRDGKASFTDEEFALRKLGTLGVNDNVQVKVFYLENNDVVIVGSDGRDDLILGVDHEGQRIINEDETLILRHVERSGADLPRLVEELAKTGDLSDDLSFIRITYKAPETRKSPIRLAESQAIENFKIDLKERVKPLTLGEIDGILERHCDNATEMHYAIRWLFQIKQYGKGADWAERFVQAYPMESEFLYLAGFGYKLAGDYTRGLDFAERLFGRTVGHEKNLVNLLDLRLIARQAEQGEQTLAILGKLYPHNEKIPRLRQALQDLQLKQSA